VPTIGGGRYSNNAHRSSTHPMVLQATFLAFKEADGTMINGGLDSVEINSQLFILITIDQTTKPYQFPKSKFDTLLY
jgi:hypothetical protein